MQYKIQWTECIKLEKGKICLKDILTKKGKYPSGNEKKEDLMVEMYSIPNNGVVFKFKLDLNGFIEVNVGGDMYYLTLKDIVYIPNPKDQSKLENFGYIIINVETA